MNESPNFQPQSAVARLFQQGRSRLRRACSRCPAIARRPRLWLGVACLALGLGLTMCDSAKSAASRAAAQELEARREAQRQQALAELQVLRKEAAGDFANLANRHEHHARVRLAGTVHAEIVRAKQQAPKYADWLLGYEASWEMLKAWKNQELSAMLARESEKRMLGRAQLAAALAAEERRLNDELGAEAEALSQRYQNRVASVLATLDEPLRAGLPDLAVGRMLRAEFGNPAIQAKLAGMGNFLGSSLLASYGIERFVQWLGPKVALKGASKIVRVGSGPIGWVAGLLGGMALEKVIDEKVLKPRLIAELHHQLGEVEATLLAATGPCELIAKDQASRARKISAALATPPTPRTAAQKSSTTK